MLRRTIEVRESLAELGGHIRTGPTKTRAVRSVSLPSFVLETLSQHLDAFPGTEYLFTSAQGGLVRHRNFMARHFRPAVERAALPERLRFHDLRHTCAAILIAQGWNPKQIQARLGHSSIRTTLDRYGHLFDDHDAQLLEGLDDVYRDSLAASSRPKRGLVLPLDAKQGPE